ncbi:MAG: hypothetical protein PVH61_39285 [Candidatus Aminicenantes bacterium]
MIGHKKGTLFLADVINYTSQSKRLGPVKTAQFNRNFEKNIRNITVSYNGEFIKRIGDAVLIFFEDEENFLDFVIELISLSRKGTLNFDNFIADLRTVAHYGKFSFEFLDKKILDLIGSEGIKVFRIEKYAGKYDVLITGHLYHVLKDNLKEKDIKAITLEVVKLKGFDTETTLNKLILRKGSEKEESNLLFTLMEELETNTKEIPVFGDLYPAMSMDENFINLYAQKESPEKDIYQIFEPDFVGMASIQLGQVRLYQKVRGDKSIDVKKLYDSYRKGIILGLPGSGKTTILKYFAYREFKSNKQIKGHKKRRVVLFIECRNIMEYNNWYRGRSYKSKEDDVEFNIDSILNYLTHCFLYNKKEVESDNKKMGKVEKIIHQAYNRGRLSILIDALDEAPNKKVKDYIIASVVALFSDSKGRKHNGNRIYLTSRYSEKERYFCGKNAEILQPLFIVQSLDTEQLRKMAEYFYADNINLYKAFDKVVWQEEIAYKVGGTPLTALLVIAYFQVFKKFDTRYHLYDIIVIFILVRVWKQIKEKNFKKDMTTFFKEAKSKSVLKEEQNAKFIYDALTLLCYDHIDKGKVMHEEDIVGVFEIFAQDVYSNDIMEEVVEKWLDQMKEEHLLISAGSSEYVFIHSTVMEYLAARYIVKKLNDPLYLEDKYENVNLQKDMIGKDPIFFESETLPIAVGSGIKNGAKLLGFIRNYNHNADNEKTKKIFSNLALKCLAEFESFIDRQYHRRRLGILHRRMQKEIDDNWNDVEWIYKYLEEILLTRDKAKLKTAIDEYQNISKLSRPDFLQKYLIYESLWEGDSEMVSLRKTLLYKIFNRELVENWLLKNQEEIELVLLKEESQKVMEAGGNMLVLDSERYFPEDKNFSYYQKKVGKILTGFLGSPNLKHSSDVSCVVICFDSKYIASGSYDNTIKLWDMKTFKEICTFKGHNAPVTSVCFSPNRKHILSCSKDHTVRLWDIENCKEIHTFNGHKDTVKSVAISRDGNFLISGSDDFTIKLWDIETRENIKNFKGHSSSIKNVVFINDKNQIISISVDDIIILWDLETGKEIRSFYGNNRWVQSMALIEKKNQLIVGYSDRIIRLWDLETGEMIRKFNGHKGSINSVKLDPKGKYLVSGSSDSTIKLWNVETGEEIRTFKGHQYAINDVGFDPDGKYIISGSSDNTIKLWYVENGKEICTFKGHEYAVNSLDFHPKGRYIISGSDDYTIRLWDMENGKEIRILRGHGDVVNSLSFDPKGNHIVSGSGDYTIKLWDMETGKEIRTLKGHTLGVNSLDIGSDGKLLVSGSNDRTIKLWDMEIGKEKRTFEGHRDAIKRVRISANEKQFISSRAFHN